MTPARPLSARMHEDIGIFGEEQGAVGEDADLVLGGLEEPRPYLAGNRPAVRVDRSQLFGACARGERTSGVGPEVGFVGADEVGQRCAVVRVGDAPVEPAADGLGIDAQAGGDVVFA